LDSRPETVPRSGTATSREGQNPRASARGASQKLSVRNIASPTAAHIHIAPKGEAGPVAVQLKTPPKNGSVSGCIQAKCDQNPGNATTVLTFWELQGIKQNAFLFYANVHNAKFPNGAIRGQLA
jgi:hypothetical protein